MKKFRIVLGVLLILVMLLNLSGCFARTRYNVFSEKEHTITQVSCTKRDYIGIVLDNEELVVCDYKGNELSRKRFEKHITNVDIYCDRVLMQFEDNSIELYYLENNNMMLKLERSFTSAISKSKLIAWGSEIPASMVVFLENGELYASKDPDSPEVIDVISDNVKTVETCGENIVYITEDGEVVHYRYGRPYGLQPEIDSEIARGIEELKIASFNGKDGFLGVGKNQTSYIRGIPLRIDDDADIAEINPETVIAGHFSYCSVLYQDDGKWYYEGTTRDYRSSIRHDERRRIRPANGESMLPIPGGVIFYTDHNVRIQLI